jgi:hypothetical protein
VTELRQRIPRIHDAAHLAFVRSQPCVICKTTRQIEAAHVRMGCIAIGKEATGLQEKPSDCWTVSLCAYHHRTGALAQHKIAEADFWKLHGRNPFQIAAALWVESGGAARALEPKRAKRRPKLRESNYQPHKPKRPKRQIPGRALQSRSTFPTGRKMQSRGFERRKFPHNQPELT